MVRFFLKTSSISEGKAIVRGSEYRHMRTVLRLRQGDEVLLFDDDGNEHEGIIAAMRPTRAIVNITRSYKAERESNIAITLAQAVPKGNRMDITVEKATELGVSQIIPFVSRYSAPQEPEAIGRDKLERWRRISMAAAKQCGRTVIPEVAAPVTWEQVVELAENIAVKLILNPAASKKPSENRPLSFSHRQGIIVAVGPEGGFSQEETEQGRRAGFQPVGLGPRILRTETAGVVAVAACQLWWGDMR